MRRFDDWEIRLEAYLRSRTAEPFTWGKHDCALFAADCIEALTGIDVAGKLRGKYKDAVSAARVMKRHFNGGVKEMAENIAVDHSFESVPILMARRGDVALVYADFGPTLAIVSMDGWHCYAPGEKCLHAFPLDKCSQAWRIQ